MADVEDLRGAGGVAPTAIAPNWAAGQVVAVSGTSAQSAAIAAAAVTLTSTTDCWITAGSNPTATAGAGSDFLPAGVKWTIPWLSGQKLAVIENASSGNLAIMPALSS